MLYSTRLLTAYCTLQLMLRKNKLYLKFIYVNELVILAVGLALGTPRIRRKREPACIYRQCNPVQ